MSFIRFTSAVRLTESNPYSPISASGSMSASRIPSTSATTSDTRRRTFRRSPSSAGRLSGGVASVRSGLPSPNTRRILAMSPHRTISGLTPPAFMKMSSPSRVGKGTRPDIRHIRPSIPFGTRIPPSRHRGQATETVLPALFPSPLRDSRTSAKRSAKRLAYA